jgi:hypothetical protein
VNRSSVLGHTTSAVPGVGTTGAAEVVCPRTLTGPLPRVARECKPR